VAERTIRLVALACLAAATIVACQGEKSSPVTVDRARASFCAHVPMLSASFAGQVMPSVDVAAAIESDAALFDLAGEAEAAAELRGIMADVDAPVPLIRAYLLPGLEVDQVDEIQEQLADLPDVVETTYASEEDNFERFLAMFEGQPSVTANVEVGSIPASFDVVLAEGTDAAALLDNVSAIEGVREATEAGPYADRDLVDRVTVVLDRECPGLRGSLTFSPFG
jgi:cell division protein FtsX